LRAFGYVRSTSWGTLFDVRTIDQMEDYYAAYRAFGAMRESDIYQLRIKMASGELYMVDNRRVLHGRTGFSSSGGRHLHSCYIECDDLISRLSVLGRTRGQ
jgi:gamma-butyrobetaine dioxygenase